MLLLVLGALVGFSRTNKVMMELPLHLILLVPVVVAVVVGTHSQEQILLSGVTNHGYRRVEQEEEAVEEVLVEVLVGMVADQAWETFILQHQI